MMQRSAIVSKETGALIGECREYRRNIGAHEYFEEHAQRAPDAVALRFQGRVTTYGALAARANDIAGALRADGVCAGDIVGVHLKRCVDLVAAVIGIWKCGAVMLPLDPEFPAARLQYMTRDAGAGAVLTQGSAPDWLATLLARSIDTMRLAGDAIRHPFDPPKPNATSPAYVIYTSGSTGAPKGVVNTHRALCNFIEAMMAEPGVCAHDRLLAVTTLSFDIALLELFVTLSAGGEIILADADQAADGAALGRLLADHGASVMQGTPATWRMLLDAGWEGPSRMKALCGGEAMPRDLADRLRPRVKELWNMYGPTETTVWSTATQIETSSDIHVGRPIANTQIYILDEDGAPVAPGEEGIVWIGGDGVSLGYLGKANLTADRFRMDPFFGSPGTIYNTGDWGRRREDGCLEILGRKDDQVKIRGYRIELGDIEAALNGHEGVREAAAAIRNDASGECSLIAYFVAAPGARPTATQLRAFLREHLPFYMTPQFFVELEALPLTANRKLDRNALPAIAASRPMVKQPVKLPPQAQRLAAIWTDILKIDPIEAADNFFDLGGQSLQAARMIARAREELGLAIAPDDVAFASLEQLAGAAGEAA